MRNGVTLIDPDNTTRWLIDLAENNTGISASPALYSQLLKNEIQLRYDPAWTHHPTYLDLLTLLEGQPILQDLDSFVDSVNRAASEAIIVLQDIYRDIAKDIPWDIMDTSGWDYISSVYTDACSWFQCKYLREPAERDYTIKTDSNTEESTGTVGLYAEPGTPFSGLLIKAPGEKDAIQLRILHLKLRRYYRTNDKMKDLVNIITQLEVQKSRVMNAFSQFSRLNP
jgi:hypothetical protein